MSNDINSKKIDEEFEERLNKKYEKIDAKGKLGGVLFDKLIKETNETIEKINQTKKNYKEDDEKRKWVK